MRLVRHTFPPSCEISDSYRLLGSTREFPTDQPDTPPHRASLFILLTTANICREYSFAIEMILSNRHLSQLFHLLGYIACYRTVLCHREIKLPDLDNSLLPRLCFTAFSMSIVIYRTCLELFPSASIVIVKLMELNNHANNADVYRNS